MCLNPFPKPAAAANPLHVDSSIDDGMAYYPSLPLVRSWEIYVADKTSQQDKCKKNSLHHPSLLPGIFTVFCPHGMSNYIGYAVFHVNLILLYEMNTAGICYGFQVMRRNESSSVPFNLFLTRFVTG